MDDRSVSVVIPTFNRLPLLGRALASVFAQTVTVREAIVVDDGSTDGTAERLASGSDPRVKVVRIPQSQGAAHARNVGLDACRDRFVAFLDSDDEWMPRYVETMLSFFDQDPRPLAVCSAMIIRSGEEDQIVRPEWPESGFDELLSYRSRVGIGIVAELESLAGLRFDERLPAAQEHDFLIALSKRGWIACSKDPLYIAHQDATERISHPRNHVRARVMLIEKYASDLAARPAALANNYYRLARVQQRLGDHSGVRESLRRASSADPTDRRLRALARIADAGPWAADAGLRGFIRLALLKKSIGSHALRGGRMKQGADA